MARIGFEIEGYPMSVSTHGYFSVGSPTTPDGVLYGASVRELGHGIHWTGDEDEVVPDIEDPLVRQAAEEWVAGHRDLLAKANEEAEAEWRERQTETRTIGGIAYRIGQRVRTFADEGQLLDAIPEGDGKSWTVHYRPDGRGVCSLIVGPMTGNRLDPVATN